MNKSKLSVYLDSFLISTITSILTYLWINRCLKNAILSFFICILIYIIAFYLIFCNFSNKYNVSKLKLFEQKQINNYLIFFTYSSNNFDKIFFKNLLNSNHILNNLYENNNTYFYINLKNVLTENDFHFANDFYQKTNKDKPLIFISPNGNEIFFKLLNNSPIKYSYTNFNELYNLMKSKNTFPEVTTVNQSRIKKFKKTLLSSFKKNNFFKFLFSGLTLITFSIFIPFSFYYMIFGSILLFFSILCLLSKNTSTNTSKIDLFSLTKKD